MKRSEARAVVGLLGAFWPSPAIPDESAEVWTGLLEEQRFGLEDASNGLRLLAENNRFRPAIAEVIAFADELWRDRLRRDTRALPASPIQRSLYFGEWLRDHATPEEREKVARFSPGLAAKYGTGLEEMFTKDNA